MDTTYEYELLDEVVYYQCAMRDAWTDYNRFMKQDHKLKRDVALRSFKIAAAQLRKLKVPVAA